jgi:type III secretion system YscD/HrpQ family protein
MEKFPAVHFSYNPASGKLFLVGHVSTTVDFQEMQYLLSQIPDIQSIEDTVVIDEKVWRMMNDILAEYPKWKKVNIHSSVAGKFIIQGTVPTAQDALALSEYMVVNFPYLDRLDNKVISEDLLATQIGSIIASKNLGGLSYQMLGSEVILTGRFNEEKETQYLDLIKELNHIQGITSVKSFAIPSHPDLAGINITNQYQVTGAATHDGNGYNVILNGKIFAVGDFVDGMKIVKIASREILLEKEGLKYTIDYTAPR